MLQGGPNNAHPIIGGSDLSIGHLQVLHRDAQPMGKRSQGAVGGIAGAPVPHILQGAGCDPTL